MNLRKLRNEDAPLMLEWMEDFDIIKHLQADFSKMNLEDCITFISNSKASARNIHLAVVDDHDDYMGTVSLKNITDDCAEFAITVRKTAMGKGFAQFAMNEIIQYAFTQLHLEFVYWSVSPDNKRAVRFYDKNGYTRIDSSSLPINASYTSEQISKLNWYRVTNNTK